MAINKEINKEWIREYFSLYKDPLFDEIIFENIVCLV